MASKFLNLSFLVIAALPLISGAQMVMPVLNSTKYTLTMGNISFQATAKNAGRIQSVMHSGSQVLHQDTNTATQYGSTFWPSPQVVWNWPPPANLDGTGAYTASIGGDSTVNFVGLTDNTTKLRFRKKYWAQTADSSFNMRYTMMNTLTKDTTWAPWEDTRIDTGGIYLFPKGTGAVTGALATYTKDSLGMIWYAHNANTTLTSGTNKFYADGTLGWYAHVWANRLVLIKKFTDSPVAKKAPGVENEIEFYSTNKPLGNTSFIEMEAQGAYDVIKANDSVSWDMKWMVRKLPDSVAITVGNPSIVSFITKVVATAVNTGPTSLTSSKNSSHAGFKVNYSVRGLDFALQNTS